MPADEVCVGLSHRLYSLAGTGDGAGHAYSALVPWQVLWLVRVTFERVS
jgi:hypothetical protein